MQSHPLGVVPKKHSSDWRTIYHLSYPEGDSINDYIPKEPYALQYVRVDDAIRILLSLGQGSYGSYKTITAYSTCFTFWTIFSSLNPRGLNV